MFSRSCGPNSPSSIPADTEKRSALRGVLILFSRILPPVSIFTIRIIRSPCSECLLMQFVPQDRRETRSPCRHIPLTSRGETVNSFYGWGTEEELETALRAWLLRSIALVE
jgi:hypothetical protein